MWLPRPIHDKAQHEAAKDAIAPLWGLEHRMTADQADWFALVTDLIADYEDRTGKRAKPLAKRFAVLVDAHAMTAADFGRFLGLEPSVGSKLINGSCQFTAAHIRALSEHFALSVEFFL